MVDPQHDPLKTAVGELESALDLALKEAKTAAEAGKSTVNATVNTAESAATGAEAFADTELEQVVTTLEGMMKQFTTLAHITKPTS